MKGKKYSFYTIELTEDELLSVFHLIGNTSFNSRVEMGLTEYESSIVSHLFKDLGKLISIGQVDGKQKEKDV